MFVGTANYVSPEFVNDRVSTFASDIWTLGIIIYMFFAGVTPFTSTDEDGDIIGLNTFD